jgi:hypothetical protein
MIQNHTMQLLALTAMEPPVSLDAEAVRDEKVKVLKAIQPLRLGPGGDVARAQYGPGMIGGKEKIGYLQEEGINPHSSTETYAAIRLSISNWRWQGVPFFLRSGKRMARRVSEIAIQFKRPPGTLFAEGERFNLAPNTLAFQIQPDEGLSLVLNGKIPGLETRTQPVKMNFRYSTTFGSNTPEAYERLVLDAMIGDGDLRGAAALDQQLALAGRAVFPALGQADGAARLRDRDQFQAAAGHAVRRGREVSPRGQHAVISDPAGRRAEPDPQRESAGPRDAHAAGEDELSLLDDLRLEHARGLRAVGARRDGRRRDALHSRRRDGGVVETLHADPRGVGRGGANRARSVSRRIVGTGERRCARGEGRAEVEAAVSVEMKKAEGRLPNKDGDGADLSSAVGIHQPPFAHA